MPKPGDLFTDSKHISVPGNPTLVSGSARIPRDPSSLVNYWEVKPAVGVIAPRPVDEDGTPMRWCSAGHYDSVKRFGSNKARKDGKDNYCKACRKVQNHVHRMTAAASVGRK